MEYHVPLGTFQYSIQRISDVAFGCPGTGHADAHGYSAFPGRAAAPARTVWLYFTDDPISFLIRAERNKHLISLNLVQYFKAGLSYFFERYSA